MNPEDHPDNQPDWGALKYLTEPENMEAFASADVILGIDVATGREMLVYGRDALERIVRMGQSEQLRVIRVPIVSESDELEMLLGACQAIKGRDDYEASA